MLWLCVICVVGYVSGVSFIERLFNKPMILASLFAAMSSFFVRFRELCNGEQSNSSDWSTQSKMPSHTNDRPMQELGSDLQLNWFGSHLDRPFELRAARHLEIGLVDVDGVIGVWERWWINEFLCIFCLLWLKRKEKCVKGLALVNH